MITTEYTEELNVSSLIQGRFSSALSSRLNDIKIPVNNIYNLYITSGATTTRRLVTVPEMTELAGWQVPDILKRNLNNEFMVGMYSFGENLPFIILTSTSFENSFAGMLEWEKTMEKDLATIFRLGGSGALEQALTPGPTRSFQDLVVSNQDTRVLRNENGEVRLLYGIFNKNIIIITRNQSAYTEIVNRLNREKSLRR
jgi:hypothetical protein